jgi:hypothetical protein
MLLYILHKAPTSLYRFIITDCFRTTNYVIAVLLPTYALLLSQKSETMVTYTPTAKQRTLTKQRHNGHC